MSDDQYQSFETSADEEDQGYTIWPLTWLRRKYRDTFKELDDFYTDNKMTKRDRDMQRPRMIASLDCLHQIYGHYLILS